MNDLTVRSENKMVSQDTWKLMMEQGTELIKSGFLPSSIKTPAQAIAVILTGRELGIGMMESFRGIDIIEGKPAIKPQLMLSLIYNSGVLSAIDIDSKDDRCIVSMSRKGLTPVTVSFGIPEATKLNLMWKDNYKKQAKNMFRWRAIAACARIVCPDVIGGLYMPEELENAEDEIGVEKSALALSEKLATDPTAYDTWREQTMEAIMDSINICTETGQLRSVNKQFEKEIGMFNDQDRGYILERFDSALQSIVDGSKADEQEKVEPEPNGKEIEGTEAEIIEKPKKKAFPPKDAVAEGQARQDFVQKAVKEIEACTTTAQLTVWKKQNEDAIQDSKKEYGTYVEDFFKVKWNKLTKKAV
jgi:hypothetical protein